MRYLIREIKEKNKNILRIVLDVMALQTKFNDNDWDSFDAVTVFESVIFEN